MIKYQTQVERVYKIPDQYASKGQCHERQGKTEKLPQTTGRLKRFELGSRWYSELDTGAEKGH